MRNITQTRILVQIIMFFSFLLKHSLENLRKKWSKQELQCNVTLTYDYLLKQISSKFHAKTLSRKTCCHKNFFVVLLNLH